MRTNWQWLLDKHGRRITGEPSPTRAGKKPPRTKRKTLHGEVSHRPDLVWLRNQQIDKQAI